MIGEGTTATVITRDWFTAEVYLHRNGVTIPMVIPIEALD
jgi:hypothetical protein